MKIPPFHLGQTVCLRTHPPDTPVILCDWTGVEYPYAEI